MKKILVLLFIILLSGQGMASETISDPAIQALVVIPSADFDEDSLQTVIDELTTYDINGILAGPDPEDQVIYGREVQPLNSIPDLITNETAILVIGGRDMGSLFGSESLTRIIQNASHAGSICAGIGNGTLVLG